jgi:hypothetical protein
LRVDEAYGDDISRWNFYFTVPEFEELSAFMVQLG